MAALAKNHRLCFILLVVFITSATPSAAALSGSYSSRCVSPSPAADQHTDVDDASALLRSFHITSGVFSGEGADILFAPRSFYAVSGLHQFTDGFVRRSFSLLPHSVSRTTEPGVLHLAATLTLSGSRVQVFESGAGRSFEKERHSISFYLDGYYSSTSAQLCMVGEGSDLSIDGSMKHYADVALHLRIPSPSSLTDPFVTGSLEGADFEPFSLVTYAEGSSYSYGENASCLPEPDSQPAAARRGIQTTPDGNFSCATLQERIATSYRLEYGPGYAVSFPSLHDPRMYVNQVHCTPGGAVRAYAVFSNDTADKWGFRHIFLSEEAAVVADGHWDSDTNRLCLRACLVARSSQAPATPSTRTELQVHECGIGMSLWFPAVWTVRDRSVAAGVIWNATQMNSSDNHTSVGPDALITASSFQDWKGNLSDVKYIYNFTMIEEAKKHYLKAGLSTSKKKKSNGSFLGNYTYSHREFYFPLFFEGETGSGHARPVMIGSAMVDGDHRAANHSFSRHAAAQLKQSTLVNVSYDMSYDVAPKNWSSFGQLERQHIRAEGVYDPTTGSLCMVGCGEHNGSMDCKILVSVQFFGGDKGFGYGGGGRGRISSLRDSSDRLYFPGKGFTVSGMYWRSVVSESIWRMDMESVVVVISTTMTCVLTVLQILHTKRNPRAAASTSITMLAVQALGLVTPLVVNSELVFFNKRKDFAWLSDSDKGWLHLNELMLRVPTLIAFVLQLRLLQLAWSGRISVDRGSEGEASPAAVERKVLRTCLPLYVVGAAVTGVAHMMNVRAAREAELVPRRFAPAEATTLWGDLASYAGLVLDGFLLPQVIFNAASGSRVKAISPWFYVGGTAIRGAPHAYDAFRAVSYAPTHVYASSRDDFFGVAWDIVVPLGAALLAFVLFLQQRLGGDLLLRPRSRGSGDYQLVSTTNY
ncbi:uncharacterized protein LOC102720480 [Oryza brachyantha]|uniref:RING-type E3 ubiquitin transferase n=1 Tax=Oryza brachyantha TaxID=4533 RepID=J3L2V3_ORYBR|nr:uncharacterized protein LOC102720480 [Oryza brachyantha]